MKDNLHYHHHPQEDNYRNATLTPWLRLPHLLILDINIHNNNNSMHHSSNPPNNNNNSHHTLTLILYLLLWVLLNYRQATFTLTLLVCIPSNTQIITLPHPIGVYLVGYPMFPHLVIGHQR